MADKQYRLSLSLSNGNTIDAGTFTVPQGEKGYSGVYYGETEPTGNNKPEVWINPDGEFSDCKGDDGYTPIKGVDYFTEADKQELISAVIAALPVYNGEVV